MAVPRVLGWTVAAVVAAGSATGAGTARAQTAEGNYPAVLACDGGATGAGLQASFTVAIAGGRARYQVPGLAGAETGSGSVSGRRLVLTGRGPGFESRYAGDVTGTGGLLTGARTGKDGRRPCQMILGDGR